MAETENTTSNVGEQTNGPLKATVDRPDVGDLELTIHAAHGLFKMMNLIDSDNVKADEQELRNVRHELAIAGERMTLAILDRL
jgi:hypothetical protein